MVATDSFGGVAMLKILIAEDDRELRQLFSHVLNRHGYTVVGVSDGQEALDALDKDFYDMIISDIMMPVIDGYELVRQLRDVGNTTPVLMITAKDAFDDMRLGFQSGVDDYIVDEDDMFVIHQLRNLHTAATGKHQTIIGIEFAQLAFTNVHIQHHSLSERFT